MSKPKPVEGHKLARISYGVDVSCECGWRSSTYFGKGARGFAYQEFAIHKADRKPTQ